jgi:hypothetical protein
MRRLVPTLLVLAALFGLVRLFRYARQFDPTLAQVRQGAGPEVSIKLQNATIVSRKRGVREWTVKANSIDVHPTEYGGLENYASVDFHGIHNGTLYRDGKPEARFHAKSAAYRQNDGTFDISGPMGLVSKDNDRLDADSCQWSERTDEVRLTRGVRAVLQGHKLESPYVLFSPRKRLVNCPQGGEAKFGRLTARTSIMVWDIKNGLVDCRGPVSGERKNMTFYATDAKIYLTAVPGSKGKQTEVSRFIANNGAAQFRIQGDDFDPEVLR